MRIRRDTLLEAVDLVRRFTARGKRIAEEFRQIHFRDDAIVAGDGRRAAKVELVTGLRCSVGSRPLATALRNVSSPHVQLAMKGDRLHLKAGPISANYEVSLVEPNALDEQEWGGDAEWSPIPDGLIGAMNLVGFAASRDINTGVYRGALFRGDRVVATDRVQIASVRLDAASHPDVVLDRPNIKLLALYRDRLTHYRVQGPWSVFHGDGVTMAFEQSAGRYTDKVFTCLEQSRQMACSVVLPANLEAAVRRHLHQQGKVRDLDRDVTLDVAGDELTLYSTDGVRYELTETLPLRGAVQPMTFSTHPDRLLNGLRLSRRMFYDPKTVRNDKGKLCPVFPFVAFRSAGLTYLADVQYKYEGLPSEARL